MKDEFEVVCGYHENIVALNNEISPYFSAWQFCGKFTKDELSDFYNESENSFCFTPSAYEELKQELDLPDENSEDFDNLIYIKHIDNLSV